MRRTLGGKRKIMIRQIQNLFHLFGIDIRKVSSVESGSDPWEDMKKFIKKHRPIIFDIGANCGQSIYNFRKHFPDSIIYSFEPSPNTFNVLQEGYSENRDNHLVNIAIGSKTEEVILLENINSRMSSILPLGKNGSGKIVRRTKVIMNTIDEFCKNNQINHIDILKSDTQGLELEVYKGAEKTLNKGQIRMIYYEVNISEIYQNLPKFTEVIDYLLIREYKLIAFYKIHYQKQLASWTDALFIHKSYL
jgi:FkbM family methyltransferase